MHVTARQKRTRSLRDQRFTPLFHLPRPGPLPPHPTAPKRTLGFERGLLGHFPSLPHAFRTLEVTGTSADVTFFVRCPFKNRLCSAFEANETVLAVLRRLASITLLAMFPWPQSRRSDLPSIIPGSGLRNSIWG